MELIADIRLIYDNYDFETEILVASVRHPIHVLEAAKIGADVMTAPPAVIRQLFKHPLTDTRHRRRSSPTGRRPGRAFRENCRGEGRRASPRDGSAGLRGLSPARNGASVWRGPSLAHQRRLLGEAEAFMADYARRLLAGDRAGIAALYDRDGVILIRGGQRINASHAEVVRRYAGAGWGPPASFEWRDLHFEAAGPDAVIVLGRFAWGEGDRPAVIGTYHALLRREDGRLAIRIEDEAIVPAAGR